MTTKKKDKVFKGASYRDMLHFVASADYRSSQVCRTGNKRLYVKNYKVYCDNTLVAIIDAKKEIVLELDWDYFRSTIFGNVLWAMHHAFDHYKSLKLPALNKKDIQSWLNQTLVSSRATYKRTKDWTWDHQMNLVDYAKEYGKRYNCTFKGIDELESLSKSRVEYWQKKYDKERELNEQRCRDNEAYEAEDWKKLKEICESILQAEYPDADNIYDKVRVLQQHRFSREDKDKYQKMFKCICPFSFSYDGVASYKIMEGHVMKVLDVPDMANGRRPDLIWYDVETDSFVTSQGVRVEVKGLVNKLLDTVIAAGNAGDHELMETVLKKNAGPYEIREFDWDNKCLRVGCHVFAWDNLVYLQQKYYGLEVERQQSIEASYNRLIKDCESTINKQMALISKYKAKLKLLKNSASSIEL